MKSKLKYISSMLIFGSVGLFVRYIPLDVAQIAWARGIIGCCFLLAMLFFIREKMSWRRLRPDIWVLLASGAAIGINWIFLFLSYNHTSIANATICYYLAPVIVVFLSPFLLKEKLSGAKVCCILAALLGIVLMTGFPGRGTNDLLGIIYGLLAALFYATVIILNKYIRHATDFERTVFQLAFTVAALGPYVLIATPPPAAIDARAIALLLVLGVVHTGFAYYLYFSGLHALKAQTAALLSYIDPLTAIILSTLILHEQMTVWQIVGGVLILGAAYFSVTPQRG